MKGGACIQMHIRAERLSKRIGNGVFPQNSYTCLFRESVLLIIIGIFATCDRFIVLSRTKGANKRVEEVFHTLLPQTRHHVLSTFAWTTDPFFGTVLSTGNYTVPYPPSPFLFHAFFALFCITNTFSFSWRNKLLGGKGVSLKSGLWCNDTHRLHREKWW